MIASGNSRAFSWVLVMGLLLGISAGYGAPTPGDAHIDADAIISDVEEDLRAPDRERSERETLSERVGFDAPTVEMKNELPTVSTPADGYVQQFYLSLVFGMLRVMLYVANAVAPIAWHVSRVVPLEVVQVAGLLGLGSWLRLRVKKDAHSVEPRCR